MNRILGLDYGSKRIGLSISDPLKIFASPYKVIINDNIKDVIIKINQIVDKKNIEKIIIGYPLNLKSEQTAQTIEVESFINLLNQKIEIPIKKIDERFTSKISITNLNYLNIKSGYKKEQIDMQSATIILQDYLDIKKKNDTKI